MTPEPLVVAPDVSLKEAARFLEAHGIAGVPVVDALEVVGVISESDIVAKEQESTRDAPLALRDRIRRRVRRSPRVVREVMSAPPVTAEPSTTLAGAAWLMTEHDVARLPVLEGGKLVGIVSRSDLVRAFARSDAEVRQEIVEEIVPSLGASAADLVVEVRNGSVLLRGIVDDELEASCLPHAVRAVAGVVDVEAEIVARHPHRAASTAR